MAQDQELELSPTTTQDVRFWTSDTVASFVRRRLLEQEVDVGHVSRVCEVFEEHAVDGEAFLGLTDHKLRFDLGVGAAAIRRQVLVLVRDSRPAARRDSPHRTAPPDLPGEEMDLPVPTSDSDLESGETSQHSSAPAGQLTELQLHEARPLLRVVGAITVMAIAYCTLGQSLPYWHVRSVRMEGPGQKIHWVTRMGLWGFESEGQYKNNAMFGVTGLAAHDDFEEHDSYTHSKWQCKPPTNPEVQEFCAAIRFAQFFETCALCCALTAGCLCMLALVYDRPLGCSRYFAVVSLCQAVFSVAAIICADAAFTAQLRRYGDPDITAASCRDKYLTWAVAFDDNWYDDDWVWVHLSLNDDHYDAADVRCGYHVAFVLQCFVPFLALLQTWLFLKASGVRAR